MKIFPSLFQQWILQIGLVGAFVLIGCTSQEASFDQEAAVQKRSQPSGKRLPLVGEYYRGDGKGYNLSLTLDDNGRFHCKWTGCLGDYGSSSGTWSVNGDQIEIATATSDGLMKDNPLGTLAISNHAGSMLLIPDNDRAGYDRFGPKKPYCFWRVEDR